MTWRQTHWVLGPLLGLSNHPGQAVLLMSFLQAMALGLINCTLHNVFSSTISNFKYFRPSTGSNANAWNKQDDNSSVKNSVTGDTEALMVDDADPPKGCWHSFTSGIGGE